MLKRNKHMREYVKEILRERGIPLEDEKLKL